MKLLPVIHVTDEAQALEQATIATEAGADGVWLINHGIDAPELWRVFEAVRQKDPGLWIGLNFLDLLPIEAMHQMTDMVDGLWCDDGGIRVAGPTAQARAMWGLKESKGWKGQLFGGVAFKGQRPVEDCAAAAKLGAPVMDVVTTSGTGTGVAAAVEKIAGMKAGLGDRPLAVASGITPDNVLEYVAYVDYFLVATGISRDFHHLDPGKTAALAGIIHEFNKLGDAMGDPVRREPEPPEPPEGV